MVLQALYGLADEQTEFQIRDRLSFMRFFGLQICCTGVFHARTIWLFREQPESEGQGGIDVLFARFDGHLRDPRIPRHGRPDDRRPRTPLALVAPPRQRNTDAEKADVKAGRIPEDWAANPAKLHQKDRDGRWTLKRGRRKRKPDGTPMMQIATPVYGYKSHVGVDRRHRFIRTWSVTDAARYDGRELPGLPRQLEHRLVRLGRHRLSIREERKAHRQGRTGLEGPLPQAARQADARPETARQRRPLAGAVRRRACLRGPEAPHGALHTHHRHRQSARQNRPRQHRLQHAPASVLGDHGRDSIARRAMPATS